jgi:predicted membrane-bound dolichyl-phosphate-mannose-protein mannosyltransferase
MRLSVLFALTLEAAFLVYCMYLIYLLDVLDPFPREWMIPNILLGAVVLTLGYVVAQRLKREDAAHGTPLSNLSKHSHHS